MKIALAGNPNSGKTTLFNALTGRADYVGNWAGVTVEKKEADLKKKFSNGNTDVKIIDLPGAYSIAPFTGEEAITSDFILDDAPDVIVNIVDGANFERSLFFTTQLLELNIPLIIALNKSDIVAKRGDEIDLEQLSKALNCQVVTTTATSESGLSKLMQTAIQLGGQKGGQKPAQIVSVSETITDKERQAFISDLSKSLFIKKKASHHITLSDKVDRIVAHKYFGLPIFFL